ncbi:MAG TPA: anti-sigma factor [Tepidisphaeraceae bacterium]|nr:anti-sigma factor [Tepidisphaeraceae bacterium]
MGDPVHPSPVDPPAAPIGRAVPSTVVARPTRRPIATAIALAGLALSITVWVVLRDNKAVYDNFMGQIAKQRAEIFRLEERLSSTEQRLRVAELSVDLLRAPDLQTFVMPSGPAQPEASARVFYAPSQHACRVEASGFKPLPVSKIYQIWFHPDGADPVPAGTFYSDSTGRGLALAKLPPDGPPPARITITIELPQGAKRPTGAPQLELTIR